MTELSEIQHFYQGSTIFLTGATGFVGKLVLEKLLRSCPGICHIYILIRQKKGKDTSARFMEIFDCPVYDILKRTYPTFSQKITIMNGDCMLPDLGLGEQDKNIIIEDVNIIIHCAATVRFDQKLSQATRINVRSTRDLLRIANKMHHLKSFVHVSTAYSNCDRKEIDEVIYPPKLDGHKLIQAVDALNDELLYEMQAKLLGDLPNTYTVTKQIAEDVVRQDGQTLPVCIVRPSIVIATAEEPISGYIDNYYGPTGIFIGGALGLLKSIVTNPAYVSDLVPVDIVVNHIVAAGWYIGNKRVTRDAKEPEVLNMVTSANNPIKWGDFARHMSRSGPNYASVKQIMYPQQFIQPNLYIHKVLEFFLHKIPSYMIDFFCICTGRKPMLVEAYKKINHALSVVYYFATHQWIFRDTKTRKMLEQMTVEDRRLFNFDIKSLNWEDYLELYLRGMRVYILQDPMDTIDSGKRHLRKLKIIHYSVIFTVIFMLLLLIYYVLF